MTLLTVGIPSVLLAYWARPGPPRQDMMLRRLAHFVLTPLLLTSVIALLLFYGTYLVLLVQAGLYDVHLPTRLAMEVASYRLAAQTTLTLFLVLCGLFLVIFAAPPMAWWAGGAALSGDRRPTILAVCLMAALAVIEAVPLLRGFFGLVPLGPTELGLLAAAVVLWLLTVRVAWRRRIIARFLGLPPAYADPPS